MRWRILALSALLAACTPVHWSKPGAGLTDLQDDRTDCRRAAMDQAWREERLSFWGRPAWMGSRFASPAFSFHRRPSLLDRMMHEDELASFCLRNKGWKLESVQDGK
ncbi:MAG: hypothetical protein H7841_04745 [Magnetospirillum sp. WYHS-4]